MDIRYWMLDVEEEFYVRYRQSVCSYVCIYTVISHPCVYLSSSIYISIYISFYLSITRVIFDLQPLSRLGADVVGIDPTATAITVAKTRAERDYGITKNLTYYCCSVEELQDIRSAEAVSGSDKGRGEKLDIRERVNKVDGDYMSEGQFDCVVASEVAEHVSNLEMFVENIGRIVKVIINQISYSVHIHDDLKIRSLYVL